MATVPATNVTADSDSRPPIYTIGHGNAPAADVIALLHAHEITMLVDVRSIPASSYVPQFNRATFSRALAAAGIGYLYMGNVLGGRPRDPQLYKNGVLPHGKADYLALVDYGKVAAQSQYREAITDLIAFARTGRTAIMCSEENPQQCHRLHLVARTLLAEGNLVYHLRHYGPVEVAPFELFTMYHGSNDEKDATREYDMTLYTIGFTRKSAKQFFELLQQNGVRRLVDIRLRPNGQLAGFTKRDDLAYFLPALIGCEYHHNPLLAPTPEVLAAYRAGGDWEAYVTAFEALMDGRNVPFSLDRASFEEQPSCLLCSEPTAEQCHRRLVAERIARTWAGTQIVHLG